MKEFQELHDKYIRTNHEIEKMEKLLSGGIDYIRLMGTDADVTVPAVGEVGVTLRQMCEALLEKMKAKRHSLLEQMTEKA